MGQTGTDDATTRVVMDDEGAPRPRRRPVLDAGSTLGRYVIREMAGRGGMGQVYRAFDPDLGRDVALKVLERPDGSTRRTTPEWLVREAQAMARLSHPNVVPVYDVETFGDRVYMVMEFVEGRTLDAWLRPGSRSMDQILEMFVAAGQGLAAAHAAGVVHRDFKPTNVLVSDDGVPRVMDFGIAHTSADEHTTSADGLELSATSIVRTEAGVVMGTPAYMSPEQHVGAQIDARSDQYSFCVALFEAIEQRRPFDAGTVLEVAALKSAGPPPVTRSGVAARVRRALQRGMAPDRDRRFEDMEALLRQLRLAPRRRWIAGVGLVAAAGAAALAWAWPERPAPCGGMSPNLDGAGDGSQQLAIQRAMLASGVSFASDSAARVRGSIRTFRTQWMDTWMDTCITREPPAHQDEVVDCLVRQRTRLEVMTTALLEVDAKNAARAVSAVWSLPDPRSCLEPTGDGADTPPAALAEPVAEIREVLDHAAVQRSLGRNPEALAMVQQVQPKAEALGYPRIVAEVELELGFIGARYPEVDAAQVLEAAYFRSIEAEAYGVAAQAAIELIYVHGSKAMDLDRALDWERHAQAALQQVHEPQTWGANLQSNTCAALLDASRFDDARQRCQRAVEIYEAEYGPAHPKLLTPLHNLAKLELLVGRFDEAGPIAQRVGAIAKESYGPRHPWMRNALGLMGAVAGRSGRHQEALGHFREALEITKATTPHAVESVARQLENMSITHAMTGDLASAQAAIEEAIDYTIEQRGPDEPTVGKLRGVLGRVLEQAGKHDEAQRQLEVAIERMVGHYGEGHVDVVMARSTLAEVAYTQGRLGASRDLFESIASVEPSAVMPDKYVGALLGLAKIAIREEKLDEVVPLLDRARAFEALPPTMRPFLAEVGFTFAKAAEGSEVEALRESALAQARLAAAELGEAEDDARVTELRAEIASWLAERR